LQIYTRISSDQEKLEQIAANDLHLGSSGEIEEANCVDMDFGPLLQEMRAMEDQIAVELGQRVTLHTSELTVRVALGRRGRGDRGDDRGVGGTAGPRLIDGPSQ
jgi:hypothetical protein